MFGKAGVLVLAIAAPASQAQFRPPPSDGEIRTVRDTITHEVSATLTLVLQGPEGQLPFNMVFVRTKHLRIDIDLRMLVGIPDYRPPHLEFVLDKGTKTERLQAHEADPKTPLRVASHATIPLGPKTLGDLAAAKTVQGVVLGMKFELTPKQLRALTQFAREP